MSAPSRPPRAIIVTRARAAVYRALIALAGRKLLWPLVVVLGVAVLVIAWPLVLAIIGAAVVILLAITLISLS